MRDGDKWCHFTEKDGLPIRRAWVLLEGPKGAIWIGGDKGLTRYKEGTFARVTADDGLYDNIVNEVLVDREERFWISCNRGVYRVDEASLNAVADGKRDSVDPVVYGTVDGMANPETNGERQPAGCVLRDGRLAFPTVEGVAIFDPEILVPQASAPRPLIEGIRVSKTPVFNYARSIDRTFLKGNNLEDDFNPARFDERTLTLAPHQRDFVEIDFTAPDAIAPEELKFEYRLDGYEHDWIDAHGKRTAYYVNLPAGDYTFRVRARNAHHIWSEEPAMLSITAQHHFYELMAFPYVCGILLIAGVYFAHRLHLKRRLRWQNLENALRVERERRRIAQDMHDDLGSRLTQLGYLSNAALRAGQGQPKLREQLEQIATTSRKIVTSLSELVWVTNPQNDQLDNLISQIKRFASEFVEDLDIDLKITAPSPVPHRPITTEVRRNCFLVVKEAMTNAVKHARPKSVELEISFQDEVMNIWMADDGVGFDNNSEKPGRNGLQNMRTRMEEIGGSLEVRSQLGQGTELLFTVPIAIEKSRLDSPRHSIPQEL